jgi:hypothetical protein
MKIVKKNQTYFLNFNNDKESQELDNYTNKELEIKIINSQAIAFSIKTNMRELSVTGSVGQNKQIIKPTISKDTIKKKIIDILQDKELTFKDKVEGNFENLLKKEDLEIFKEMLKEKEIITFKQSEKYKKAIYIVNDQRTTEQPIKSENLQKPKIIEENADTIIKDFLKKKYAIIKSVVTADKFSKEFYSKFKNDEIKGQKSFDGYFYVIDMFLYSTTRKQILSSDLDKNFSIEDLSKKLNKDTELLKITIEFLKEEGAIIEKRKNVYCLV